MVEETTEFTAKERRKEEQRFVCRIFATAAAEDRVHFLGVHTTRVQVVFYN
jgi:hypothetical protein